MKKIIYGIVFLGAFFVYLVPVSARVLPRFQGAKQASNGVVSSKLLVYPKLRSDRLALIVNFNNLHKVNSAFYTLSYQTNGKDEGVSGSLDSSGGENIVRELLFGTCSSGVCRYHENLSNMKLEVTSDLPNGKRVLKRFKVKI